MARATRLIPIVTFSRDNLGKLWHYLAVAVLPDTHRLVNILTERGFTAQQAEAITDAIQEIDLSGLATKTDLAELEARLTVRMATFIGVGVAVQSAIIAVIQIFAQ
jgi:hypothetical protein